MESKVELVKSAICGNCRLKGVLFSMASDTCEHCAIDFERATKALYQSEQQPEQVVCPKPCKDACGHKIAHNILPICTDPVCPACIPVPSTPAKDEVKAAYNRGVNDAQENAVIVHQIIDSGMNLSQIKLAIKQWREHNFPNATADSQLLGVLEELGELSHAHLKESQGIRKMDYRQAKKDAIGDMTIFLLNYCELQDLDFMECINFAWNEASKRDWVKYPQDGVSK